MNEIRLVACLLSTHSKVRLSRTRNRKLNRKRRFSTNEIAVSTFQ